MKKKIFSVLLILIMTFGSCYAEMIDENYIELIFGNFDKYTEEQKNDNKELLEVLFSSNIGLDLLYDEVVRTKSDSLKAYGVSEEELKKNIEILKGWSIEDRLSFLNAGVNGDLSEVSRINLKNRNSELLLPKSVFLQNEKSIINEYQNQFKDTNNHWSREYVVFLTERGIVSGKSESSYAPDDNVKKSEIVTLIMNVIIEDESGITGYTGNHTDIQSGMWYDIIMQNAYTLHLIDSDTSGNMMPNKLSTREEVVDMLVKAVEATGILIDEEKKIYSGSFSDFENVDPQYLESMIVAINLGFIGGMGDGTIAPDANITRGQTAVVIKKLYTYLLNEF